MKSAQTLLRSAQTSTLWSSCLQDFKGDSIKCFGRSQDGSNPGGRSLGTRPPKKTSGTLERVPIWNARPRCAGRRDADEEHAAARLPEVELLSRDFEFALASEQIESCLASD